MMRLRLSTMLVAAALLYPAASAGWRESGKQVSCAVQRVLQSYHMIRLVYDIDRQLHKSGERSGVYVLQSKPPSSV
jgi:hypothetical protein